MCVQGVKHFKDIQYNRQSKYGEILQQQEYEMSCFNLEEASIQVYQQLYDLYEQARFHLTRPAFLSLTNQGLLYMSHIPKACSCLRATAFEAEQY